MDDIASDLLDRVVDKEAELLASGDAKFSTEQAIQAQIMARRDLTLIASYIRSNAVATSDSALLLKRQNKLITGVIISVLILAASLWLN